MFSLFVDVFAACARSLLLVRMSRDVRMCGGMCIESRRLSWAKRLNGGASVLRDMRLTSGMRLGGGMGRLCEAGCGGPLLLFDPTASGLIPLLCRRAFLIGQPGVCGGHVRVLGLWHI